MPKEMHQPPKMATAANSQPTHMPLNLGYCYMPPLEKEPSAEKDSLTSEKARADRHRAASLARV